MRKTRWLLLGLALLLVTLAAPVPEATASHHWCLCEILCWDNGYQLCWQDECCQLYCCDKSDPGCWVPCW